MSHRITSIEPNVDLIELGERKFYIVGTAHVSRASADLVETIIERVKPDCVAIELCQPRFQSLQDPTRWQNTDIFEVIRSGKGSVLLVQLILSSFQKRVAKRFGITAGEEMMRAISAANAQQTTISVIDREIRITLKRAWAKAGVWSMTKIMGSLAGSLFVQEELSEKQVEELKSGDSLMAVMNEFSEFLPGVKEALIDERDSYMAEKLLRGPGNNVVAVVGAGHVPGMLKVFNTVIDLASLESIPPKKPWAKIIGWSVPVVFALAVGYGIWSSGLSTGTQMITAWVVATGTLAAVGAAAALAHPLTILTSFIAAPFTALHPMIAVGWVSGLVEALIRKPQVKDLETIAEDILTVKGFYRNRVTKVLLIMALANIGCAIGSLIGAGKIATLL